jgi:hypothetical protein
MMLGQRFELFAREPREKKPRILLCGLVQDRGQVGHHLAARQNGLVEADAGAALEV